MSSKQNDRELALAHAVNLATRGDSPDIDNADSILVAAEKFSNFISYGTVSSDAKPALTGKVATDKPFDVQLDKTGEGQVYVSGMKLGTGNITAGGAEVHPHAAHTLNCPDCQNTEKDLAAAGFPSLMAPIDDVTELSLEARAALKALGVDFFGEILPKAAIIRPALSPSVDKELSDLMTPIAILLHERSVGLASKTSYGGLPLDSFGDLESVTVQMLSHAGFNTIGDVTDNLEKVLAVVIELPNKKQGLALLGHVVTNLRHALEESKPSMSSESQERAQAEIEKLESMVEMVKMIFTLAPPAEPELTPDSKKLLDLIGGGINLGGGRFALNAADPQVAKALKELLGDGLNLQLGGHPVSIVGRELTAEQLDELEPGLRDTLKNLIVGNPGNQTKH